MLFVCKYCYIFEIIYDFPNQVAYVPYEVTLKLFNTCFVTFKLRDCFRYTLFLRSFTIHNTVLLPPLLLILNLLPYVSNRPILLLILHVETMVFKLILILLLFRLLPLREQLRVQIPPVTSVFFSVPFLSPHSSE